MAEDRISITTIGIGSDFDHLLMPMIARMSQGEFYFASSSQDIPVMMLRDVDRVLKIGKRMQPLPESSPKKELAISLPQTPKQEQKPSEMQKSAIVQRVSEHPLLAIFPEFPTITAYHATKATAMGYVQLAVDGKPLLAHKTQHGTVVAWTSKAQAWEDWENYALFWARIVRYFTPDISQIILEIHPLALDKESIPIQIWASDWQGNPIAEARLWSNRDLVQTKATSWTTQIPMPKVQVWEDIHVKLMQQHKTLGEASSAVIRPYEPEFQDLEVHDSLLHAIAQTTQGGILPQDTQKLFDFPTEIHDQSWREIPWFIGILLCLVQLALCRIKQ